MKASTKKRAAKPRTAITFKVNEDVDWTPEAAKVYPRVVSVKRGKLLVEIQEIDYVLSGKLGLMLGVGDGTSAPTYNIMCEELTDATIDGMIELIGIALSKARAAGMPSKKRGAA